eukprot:TRINITY_DN2116_c0_g1_i1.p1 TRINITY_DN2116_c0_g1~~TRINITY_DN2116_c0_g1_i1.p1  ORF type:complete len:116 (+),score=1.98 TRINITY_DN2116_c0_g1_i1:40-387(+)
MDLRSIHVFYKNSKLTGLKRSPPIRSDRLAKISLPANAMHCIRFARVNSNKTWVARANSSEIQPEILNHSLFFHFFLHYNHITYNKDWNLMFPPHTHIHPQNNTSNHPLINSKTQ